MRLWKKVHLEALPNREPAHCLHLSSGHYVRRLRYSGQGRPYVKIDRETIIWLDELPAGVVVATVNFDHDPTLSWNRVWFEKCCSR